MIYAAISAGTDGLIVEVHINPAEAKSDAQQQFTPKEFLTIMSKARKLDKFVKEVINREP
jgi:3-deoxy-7-phosphoheptulonate synthase